MGGGAWLAAGRLLLLRAAGAALVPIDASGRVAQGGFGSPRGARACWRGVDGPQPAHRRGVGDGCGGRQHAPHLPHGRLGLAELGRQGLHRPDVPKQRRRAPLLRVAAAKVISLVMAVMFSFCRYLCFM